MSAEGGWCDATRCPRGKEPVAEGNSQFHLQLQHLALEVWMGWLLLCSGAGSGAAGAGEPGWGVGDAREEQHGSVLGCGMGWGCTWGEPGGLCPLLPKGSCRGFWRGGHGEWPSKQPPQRNYRVPVLVKLSR